MNLEQAVNELVAKLREAMPDVSVESDKIGAYQHALFFGDVLRVSIWPKNGRAGQFEAVFPTLYSDRSGFGALIRQRRVEIGAKDSAKTIADHAVKWLASHAEDRSLKKMANDELQHARRRLEGATVVERLSGGSICARFLGPLSGVEAAILECAQNIIRARETPTQAVPTTNVE